MIDRISIIEINNFIIAIASPACNHFFHQNVEFRSTKRIHTEGDAVTAQNLSYQELLQLVELIKSSSQFREFRFRSGDIEIEVSRGGTDSVVARGDAVSQPVGSGPVAGASVAARFVESTSDDGGTPDTGFAVPRAAKQAPLVPRGSTTIASPMVGTFYRAPEPGARPFVEVGAVVDSSTTVCIIEVMKLMNSIMAPCRGTVRQILVGDGEAVEYGQPLVVIDPA
ncbi:MAG: acetyl-CoA carboxylase biotin carboxyl carrier protein [Gemmatimonadales bacterium]|nr:acetyl-CoA carboxylase biotin carboxyl carrier protein [Gemmatimonadales bacterium]